MYGLVVVLIVLGGLIELILGSFLEAATSLLVGTALILVPLGARQGRQGIKTIGVVLGLLGIAGAVMLLVQFISAT